MPVRKHNAPPGLDYDPITGEEQNISYGVVGADAGQSQPRRRLEDVIGRRLYPTDRPAVGTKWNDPTAERWDVLLPRGAPDEFRDPQRMCEAFHINDDGAIKHLAAVMTLKFPEADSIPSEMRLHEVWELSRGFGLLLALQLEVAAVAVLHVPGRHWGHGVPHCHLICPVRTVRPGSGFSTFVMPLINGEEGRYRLGRSRR
ncbi:MAG TPA: hypothetical protein DHB48_05510, partial [Sphingobium sp.]|nr:hypothetical protein [Sphingobium sp.]